MMKNLKMKNLLSGLLNVLDTGIAEFDHLVAIRTNQVIVLFIAVRLFVLRQVLSKLMLAYQVTFHQKVQRIVHGGPAYPVILILHADVQRLHIEMPRPRIDLLQDSVALRRLAKRLVLQIRCEDLLYLFVNGWIRKYLILCHDKLTRKDNNPFYRYKVARLFRQSGRKAGFFSPSLPLLCGLDARIKTRHLHDALYILQLFDEFLQVAGVVDI